MTRAIVITPVKDSPETTRRTIEAVCQADCPVDYIVYNDFSRPATRELLEKAHKRHGFHLVHLEEITQTPSPNYKLVLQTAQKRALEAGLPLIIVESDVVIQKDTISRLLTRSEQLTNPGLIGAITTDINGNYNFPYNFEKVKSVNDIDTSHSLSFCCTLLTVPFLRAYSFEMLAQNKDWFDVTISRQSKKLGFRNYLAKGVEVLHLPHSSRPWKNLKYTNPLLYYYRKFVNRRDRI
jgi:GT2 family glycosyltransferase